MIKEMLSLLLDETKSSLVKADGGEIALLQGRARAYSDLIDKLTRPSPVAPRE